jgi:parallel beta-helix repeat protein
MFVACIPPLLGIKKKGVKRKMKDKKKWVAIEAILKLLHDSQRHTLKEISKTLNTTNRKSQDSMYTKNSRKSEMDKSKRHRDKKEVYSTHVHPFFGMCLAVSIFMLLVAGVGVVSATNNYYVATWGDNSKSGTSLDEPWQHPSYAAQQAVAGDTIYLLDGTWYGERVPFAHSGTATNPIIMKAYSGTPTLDGLGAPQGVVFEGKAYIQLDGITTINYGMGIWPQGAHHIIIENCTAGNGWQMIKLSDSHNCEIRNCTAYNGGMSNFAVQRGYDNIIADCYSFDGEYCYSGKNTTKLTIARCRGEDGGGHGITFTASEASSPAEQLPSSYCVVTDCEMYNCWDLFGVREKGHHIEFINCYGEAPTPADPLWYNHGFFFRTGSHDNLAKNCTIVGVKQGLEAVGSSASVYGPASNNRFENCIATECSQGISPRAPNTSYINCVSSNNGVGINIWGAADELIVKNCIITENIKDGVRHAESGAALINYEFTYNDVWGNLIDYSDQFGGVSPGEGSISEDPLFADPANGDFHLKEDSPCIDTGDPSSPYSNEPAPNGGRINMGAYGNTAEATTSGPSEPDTIPPYTTGHNPAKNATGVAKDTSIIVHIRDDGAGVDQSSIEMTVEGVQVTPTITGNKYDYTLNYTTSFNYSQVVNVTIKAEDLATTPNGMPQESYSFTIAAETNSPPSAPVVGISPVNPTRDDDLICNITTESTDLDEEDVITYSYAWYKDEVIQIEHTTNTIPFSYTSGGEVWRCEVTPNDGEVDGESDEDSITITSSSQAVISFTLINADTDQPIADYEPLNDGSTLNLATLPTRNLNIRADTNPATVGSVRFGLDDNSNYRTENGAPYALAGNSGTDYYSWTPRVGGHTLTATPYTGSGASGTAGTALSICFNVVDGGEQGPVSGQIIVDPDSESWLAYNRDSNGDGKKDPCFICGPGDPEGFLYRGTRNEDGTRNGDQMTIINKIKGTGANSIYLMAVRSHGGDGDNTQNPFIDSDPTKGFDDDILNQWETWFTEMDNNGIIIFFFFYDDSARIWDTGDAVGAEEKVFIQGLVNKFKHHKNLIWCVAEEYQESFSATFVSNIAAEIRATDDHNHVIAVHKLTGLDFSEFANDPNIDIMRMVDITLTLQSRIIIMVPLNSHDSGIGQLLWVALILCP